MSVTHLGGFPYNNANANTNMPRIKKSSGNHEASASLARGEAQIQAKEKALTAGADRDARSVHYTYTTGPDGKRYITGAVVTVAKKSGDTPSADNTPAAADKASTINGLTRSEQETVKQLQEIDRDVRQHEAAHQAAGGAYAGPATFGYVRGPDGKSYAVSGQVPINTPATSDPEEAARIAARVLSAATAPGGGLSGQDVAVAAQASADIGANNTRAQRNLATRAYNKQMDFSRQREGIFPHNG